MVSAVSLTVSSEAIAGIQELVKKSEGIEDMSEPSVLDASQALNAGLTPEDLKTGLEVINLIFVDGAALGAFLMALRTWMRSRLGAISVSDAVSGKRIGRIDAVTEESTVA